MPSERKFVITGMRCTACSANVEKRLNKLAGVECVSVDFNSGICEISADMVSVPDALITETIAKLGFSAVPLAENEENDPAGSSSRSFWYTGISIAATLLLLTVSMTRTPGGAAGVIIQVLLTAVVLFCGRDFFKRGIPALLHGTPDMDTLVSCGSGAAVSYSIFLLCCGKNGHLHFDSGAMIITLVSFGKALEDKVRKNTISTMSSLAEFIPDTAYKMCGNKTCEIPAAELKKGDLIRVVTGGRIPADGVVVSGSGWVDESMFTGEPVPAEKLEGSSVSGGTLCTSGTLLIRAEKLGRDTTLANIIRMVRQAQGTKAPIARIADVVSGYFTIFILAVSAVTFVVHLVCGATFGAALNFALCTMVISCPCALGLATPVALVAGVGRGAKSGILIKSAQALENACRIKCIAFDKTGTVTESRAYFEKVIPSAGFDADTVLANLAVAGMESSHPLTSAALEEARQRGLDLSNSAEQLELIPGKGMRAVISSRHWLFGSERLICENGIAIPNLPDIGRYSTIFCACNGVYAGVAVFSNPLRAGSDEAVTELANQMGITCIMLSGDRREAVEAIGLPFAQVMAKLLPQDKPEVISAERKKHFTAMVGDGVNDAPALAAADVGIAVGSGSAAAHDVADIVIVGNDLRLVVKMIKLSRATMRIIKQNLFWAFFYNMLAIPLASGLLHALFGLPVLFPAMCAGAMAASSLTVVLNAARLRSIRL